MEDEEYLSNRQRKKKRAHKIRCWKGDQKDGGILKVIPNANPRPYEIERSRGFWSPRVMRTSGENTVFSARLQYPDGTSEEVLHRGTGPSRISPFGNEAFAWCGVEKVKIEADGEIYFRDENSSSNGWSSWNLV